VNVGALRVLAVQECTISPAGPNGLRHVEIYTMQGLVTLLWHGVADAERVVVCGGGAMGGLLGPGDGYFHDLGVTLARDHGVATIRVGYRVPNDLGMCIADLVAAGMLAERNGAESFLTVGHSFGGAVAIGTAIEPSPLAASVKAVVTLATQSAGCEEAALLARRPLLLVHGTHDEILPAWSSEIVNEMAGGHGELHLLPGAGHVLRENGASDWLREHVTPWIVSTLNA
jgi:fermentation-respiration switch protein FrsA (DUF1100 family)